MEEKINFSELGIGKSENCCSDTQKCVCSTPETETKEDPACCKEIAKKAIENTKNIVLGYN